MADIYISSSDRKKVYKLPIPPEDFPEIDAPSPSEEFKTFDNGTFTIINRTELITFGLECKFPSYKGKYKWAKSQINAYDVINLLRTAQLKKQIVRYIANRNKTKGLNTQAVNMLVSVEGLTYQELNNGDVTMKADFKEYRVIK